MVLSQDRILTFSKVKKAIQRIIAFGYIILELKVRGTYIYYVRKKCLCDFIKKLIMVCLYKINKQLWHDFALRCWWVGSEIANIMLTQ